MEKLIYLIRERASRDGAQLRGQVVGDVVPPAARPGRDRTSRSTSPTTSVTIPGPMPCPGGELPLRAGVSLWLDNHDDRGGVEELLGRVGERCDGYLVTESVYSEYGQRRGEPRSWPAGERSPGPGHVRARAPQPAAGPPDASGSSGTATSPPCPRRLQPRLRYVRNTVAHPVTAGAPPIDGIVVESWESEELVSDIEAFHNGDLENLTVMLDSVGTVFDMAPAAQHRHVGVPVLSCSSDPATVVR